MRDMSDVAIEVRGLRKRFGGQTALDGLDLQVPRGSIFGFLGRNGAGKTTTIRTLMGWLKLEEGEARVLGRRPDDPKQSVEIRQRVGFVAEDKGLYPYMTVEQVIRFTRSFYPKWREDLERKYTKAFELPLHRKTSDLSKGTRSRVLLMLAICRGAELLILDEPTDGLDPAAVEEVLRELVAATASQGTTIFFSSHQLSEVEQIADSIAIIDRGRSIVSGSLDDLKLQYQRLQVVFENELRAPLHWVDGVEHVRQEGRTVSILASRNVEGILEQIRSLPSASIERHPATLKEIFLDHVRSNEDALV
jgi:ABC-2 type transport system ATP-binding protein